MSVCVGRRRRFGALGIDIVCVADGDVEEVLQEAEPVRDAYLLVIVGRHSVHVIGGVHALNLHADVAFVIDKVGAKKKVLGGRQLV